MATDRLINKDQGDSMISALGTIATNVGNITYGPQTSADKVVSMTGYAKAGTAAAISQGDTLNEAVGKLEKKVDDNATAIDGKTAGPESATVGDIATFNNVNGKVLNDSGISIQTSVDTTKDTEVPTSKAVDAYVTGKGYAVGVTNSTANHIATFNGIDGKALKDGGATIAFNTTGVLNDDTAIPTSKAVQSYVTGKHYAGSSSDGGAATSADKLNIGSSNIGSATQPVYFDKTTGKPVAITNTIQSNVPANAVFTDTTYTVAEGTANGKIKVTPSSGTAYEVPVHGLGNAAYKGVADTVSTSTDLVTSAAVNTKLASYVPNSDFVVAKQNILYNKLWTRKNLLKLSSSINSAYGLTFTSNTDGSLTVTGQFAGSGGSYAPYINAALVLPAGTYVLSGCPSGGGENTYQLDIIAPAYYPDQGSGVEFTLSTATTIQVRCRIAQTTAIDKTFYPMICEKEVYDADPSFVCYSAPNSVLNVLEAEDRAALAEEINAGAKNVWDFANAAFGRESTNCTYTKTDTSITVSSSGGWSYVSYALPLKAGSYVLSGVLSNVNVPTGALPMIRIATASNGDGALQTVDIGGDQNYVLKFTAPSDATYYVLFSPNWQSPSYVAGYTISNIMICTKAAFGVSSKFVPYRPNWDLVGNSVIDLNDMISSFIVNSSKSVTIKLRRQGSFTMLMFGFVQTIGQVQWWVQSPVTGDTLSVIDAITGSAVAQSVITFNYNSSTAILTISASTPGNCNFVLIRSAY